jgi:hypothetical protein
MFLQGVRSLSLLDAVILLIPGYVAESLLSSFMGGLSDKYGACIIATKGCVFLIIATFIYLTFRVDTPLYYVLVASGISGIGTSMFMPANNSAVMSNAPAAAYGGISGTLRTVQNIGILGSFVVSITVASAAISRNVAFEVFIGTTNLIGGLSTAFVKGIDSALSVSIIIIAIAGIMS